MYNSEKDTLEHIEVVKDFLSTIIGELYNRAANHGASKLQSPEKEIFDEYTPKLKEVTYGSDEYKKCLAGMGVALEHHYENNRHHPEHHKDNTQYYCNGCGYVFTERDIKNDFELAKDHILCEQLSGSPRPSILSRPTLKGMNLVDLIELICDWKAASMRHADGDISRSIELNQKRFGYSDELKQILINTLQYFE